MSNVRTRRSKTRRRAKFLQGHVSCLFIRELRQARAPAGCGRVLSLGPASPIRLRKPLSCHSPAARRSRKCKVCAAAKLI